MVKMVGFDFELLSFVSVKAPVGTDPETLVGAARGLFLERLRGGDCDVRCFQIFDDDGDITEVA